MRYYLYIFSLLFILPSCKVPFDYKTIEGQAQGTSFRVSYQDSYKQDLDQSIDSLFKIIDKSMSLWDSTSLISKVNNNQDYDQLDEHFIKVFNESQKTSKITEGYFDITVGPLVKAWGFSTKKGLPPPNIIQLDSLRALVDFSKVAMNNNRILKQEKKAQIDFNAIAQGYTVDVIAQFLEQKAIISYLVEIGGEVRAKGRNKEGKTWRVGIEKPNEENSLQAVVNLDGKSLATSGSYRKFFVKDGKRFSHAINPHSGFPVSHNLLSVSVVAENCMKADAFATAFLVMGLEKAKEIAKKEDLTFYAIFDQNGKYETYTSEGFDKYLAKD